MCVFVSGSFFFKFKNNKNPVTHPNTFDSQTPTHTSHNRTQLMPEARGNSELLAEGEGEQLMMLTSINRCILMGIM